MKWQKRYGISAVAVEHRLCTAKTQRYRDRYCGSFHGCDTCSWEPYRNSIFKSHLSSRAIIQFWVWISIRWTQTTAIGWNLLKSSNSFSFETLTQKCFHFSISWISTVRLQHFPHIYQLKREILNPILNLSSQHLLSVKAHWGLQTNHRQWASNHFTILCAFQHATHTPNSLTRNQMVNSQGKTSTDFKNKQTNKQINQNYQYEVSSCVAAFRPGP